MTIPSSVLYGFCSKCGGVLVKSELEDVKVICSECGKTYTTAEYKEQAHRIVKENINRNKPSREVTEE